MGSYVLPEGEVVGGGWIRRQSAAQALRQDGKDSWSIDAVRGAHITVERLKGQLAGAPVEMHPEIKVHLAAAEERLAAASAAHEAHERGEEPEAEAEEVEETEDGEGVAAPVKRRGRPPRR